MSNSKVSNRKVKPTSNNNDQSETPKDKSQRIPQRDKIDYTLNIKGLDWTEKQKAFIELASDKETKIIFLSGPAGTSKSILSVYCSLLLLNEKKISDIIYVRTIVESAAISMGTLPGDEHSKMKYFVSVLNDIFYKL